jgi:hypothetical protein
MDWGEEEGEREWGWAWCSRRGCWAIPEEAEEIVAIVVGTVHEQSARQKNNVRSVCFCVCREDVELIGSISKKSRIQSVEGRQV